MSLLSIPRECVGLEALACGSDSGLVLRCPFGPTPRHPTTRSVTHVLIRPFETGPRPANAHTRLSVPEAGAGPVRGTSTLPGADSPARCPLFFRSACAPCEGSSTAKLRRVCRDYIFSFRSLRACLVRSSFKSQCASIYCSTREPCVMPGRTFLNSKL